MNFIPQLFIDIGEKACFFTLRETYLHQASTYTEVRSFHLFNLAQDPDEAFRKAQAAAERLGLELNTSRASMQDELNKIRRANTDELERRERERLEREEDVADFLEMCDYGDEYYDINTGRDVW